MDIVELRRYVSKFFPQVEQINESVLSFTKNQGEQPYAVYYLDIANKLPPSKELLNRYQDRLIGKRYFDGNKSLQWNNYVYFLLSDEQLDDNRIHSIKQLIENDRTYARKYVITENELHHILTPSPIAPASGILHSNTLLTWNELLSEDGFDEAIFTESDLPRRIQLIESEKRSKPGKKTPQKLKTVAPGQFIKSLQLEKYRQYPLQRSFEFGTVNLIFGANASGKTSLLEAIELFFCGRNKRNPSPPPSYKLHATLADGQTETATEARPSNLFRDRNLSWYGQAEIKTNYLFKSFAQFNFLDTDAAVRLAESTEHIEEDLSKLLVGPDASKIWRNIQRVEEGVGIKLRELRPYEEQIRIELQHLEKLLTDIANEQRQSDVLIERLKEMLNRYNWRLNSESPEEALKNLQGSLTELITLSQQAVEFHWVASPISLLSIENYLIHIRKRISETSSMVNSFIKLIKQNSDISKTIDRLNRAHEICVEILRYSTSGFIENTIQQEQIKEDYNSISDQLSSITPEFIKDLSQIDPNKTVNDSLNIIKNKRLETDKAMSLAKDEYRNFIKLREDSYNLLQQLRQIAYKIIDLSNTSNECPLCHTEFKSGDLEKHMMLGLDDGLEVVGQNFLDRIDVLESELSMLKRQETGLVWLKLFYKNSVDDYQPLLHEAIYKVMHMHDQLTEKHERLDNLKNELNNFQKYGLSSTKLKNLTTSLKQLGFSIKDYKKDTIEAQISIIKNMSLSEVETAESIENEIREVETSLRDTLAIGNDTSSEYAEIISKLHEQLASTETVFTRLTELMNEFHWPIDRSLSGFITSASSLRKVSIEARTALLHEKNINSQESEGLKRKAQLESDLQKMNLRIKNLKKAKVVFEKIKNHHSLSQAMEATLAENRFNIETIFSSIHSPDEFSGLGTKLDTLIRKVDNSEAKLTEVSTGQRAAFGLSVFLAQNSQVSSGPPVLLIDDPIAYVDDLNSLSFLDYLREIAVSGNRQIFFATANDKLAAIFERKFDFLGEKEFKRFDLSRSPNELSLKALNQN